MRKLIATLLLSSFFSVAFGQTLSEIADKQFELKAYQKAVVSYRKILADEPENLHAVANLADCYFYTNNMKDALTWYAKAAKSKPDADVLLRYGKAYMRSGDYSNAEKVFKKLSAVKPKLGQHYESYARMAASTAALPPFYHVKREYLNTNKCDFGPAFLGNKIVYSSTRRDIKRKLDTKENKNWEGESHNQVFITARDNKGYLQKPKLLVSDLAFNYNEGPVSYSQNKARTVVITKNEFINGHTLEANLTGKMILLGAKYGSSGAWEHAKALNINNLDHSSGFASFSPDGKSVFFSSNRPGGEGGYDIYVSSLENGKWSSPINVGAPINTPGDEVTPFMDGNTLYFSSNWLPGLGGFDLYRAEKGQSGSLTDWAKVFHMGTGINSSYDDYGFIFDNIKNVGYFTSNRRGTKSLDDLYKVTKVSDKIEILVLNASDGNPLNGATIDFAACGEGALKTNANGKTVFQALAGLKCDATVRKPGYTSQKLKVVSSGKMKSRSFVVKLVQSDEEYIGKVVNNENNAPIEQVLVTAYPSKGEAFKTFTNKFGEFTLPLKSNEKYTIEYSRASYSDVSQKIATGNGKNRTILGIQPMMDAYAAMASTTKGPSVKGGAQQTKAEVGKNETKGSIEKHNDQKETSSSLAAARKAQKEAEAAAEEAKAIVKRLALREKDAKALREKDAKAQKEKNAIAQKEKNAKAKKVAVSDNKYAVQVAAYVNDGKSINMSEYKSLFSVGNVYSKPSGKHVKIRVGVFDTKKEATAQLKAIKKLGFKQAFVTREQLTESKIDKSLLIHDSKTKGGKEKVVVAPKLPTPKKKTAPKAAPEKKRTKPAPKKKTTPKANGKYYIQLAAYQNVKYFPRKKVEKLGKVVSTKGPKYTTMYVTGFDSLEQAIDARNKARELGFRRPYIVYKRKGKFVRMKL